MRFFVSLRMTTSDFFHAYHTKTTPKMPLISEPRTFLSHRFRRFHRYCLATEDTEGSEKCWILDAGDWMLAFLQGRAKGRVLLSFRPSAASGGIWFRIGKQLPLANGAISTFWANPKGQAQVRMKVTQCSRPDLSTPLRFARDDRGNSVASAGGHESRHPSVVPTGGPPPGDPPVIPTQVAFSSERSRTGSR